ncbi:LysR substrate-binding domain-containing protein [Leisingera daeponensis]|uniref:LysR substrate-binding domain-containing protein n=1 Tax=Leisingera daeponensis TaxID=405746 RepID=UPI001C98443B|nr:LysR substrate-binding domain-containing protein [Leisingera daeponensis]MBY6059533.1 LysR family transcriptional regulator [Leisingera daeponensis]
MHIQLQDLQLFVQIAEAENLTRGAKRAFLSAPAASARIKGLEEQLGAQVMYRSNKGVSLTMEGETLLHHARLILRQLDFLKDDFTNGGMGGRVRIFANTTAVTEFLPEFLARFLADHPRLSVDLQETLTHDILRGIQDGTADLGIFSGDADTGDLEVFRFSRDRLLLAAPENHPLATASEISFAQTLEHEHIGLHEGSTLLAFLGGLMEKNGYERALRIKVRSFEAMCRMVEAGVGIGVVPESAARRHARTMRLSLLRLRDDWALRDRCVAVRRLSALPRGARVLVDALVRSGVGGDLPVNPPDQL